MSPTGERPSPSVCRPTTDNPKPSFWGKFFVQDKEHLSALYLHRVRPNDLSTGSSATSPNGIGPFAALQLPFADRILTSITSSSHHPSPVPNSQTTAEPHTRARLCSYSSNAARRGPSPTFKPRHMHNDIFSATYSTVPNHLHPQPRPLCTYKYTTSLLSFSTRAIFESRHRTSIISWTWTTA